MIKKKFKLSGEDLRKFFTARFKKIETDDFLIYYQKNSLAYPRFAVICKKEIFKKATLRNKIKRKIYAIINKLLKESRIKFYDFLIFPRHQKITPESFLKIFLKINV